MFKNLSENSFLIRYLHASFKLTPGKPAYLRGFRVAILLGLPVLIGLYTNMLSESFLLMFATLNVTLVDLGGMTYRKTARIMLITTLLNAVAAIVAQYAGLHILTAFVVTAIWLAAVAMLGLLGNSGVMMAFVNSAIFVIIVANPNSQATTINTFFVFIAGGLWAMFLSLIAWPIRPYQPIRKAVANCFIENSTFLRSVATLYGEEITMSKYDLKQNNIDIEHRSFREKIDKAYEMLSDERQGRFSKSDMDDILISILHNVSKDHRSIITLMNWFRKEGENISIIQSKRIEGFFLDLAEIQSNIAKLILHSKVSEDNILTKIENLKIKYLNNKNQPISERFKEIYNVLNRVLERSKTEVLLAARQKPSYKKNKDAVQHELLALDDKTDFLTLLRHNLTLKSSSFRHAIRIGITAAFAVLFAHIINLPHGYWMPLTVVVIMAPDFGGSFLIRTLQRGTGTILGGFLAVLLISQIHSQLLIIILLMIFTFLAISMLTINYAAFVFFLTPLIVTMYSISDIGDWHIPVDRVLDTLAGIALALICGQLLLPDWERNHFQDRLSSMLDATKNYFNSVLQVLAGEEIQPQTLISLNRKMELATSNANASFQRTLNQPGFNEELITPMMTFLSSSHMLMQSVIRLHEYIGFNNTKIEYTDKLQQAGKKISELIKIMSKKLLRQKPNNSPEDNNIIDFIVEMTTIAKQLKSILENIPEDSLPEVEFKLIAKIEFNMLDTLSLYLSKQAGVELQDAYLLNH